MRRSVLARTGDSWMCRLGRRAPPTSATTAVVAVQMGLSGVCEAALRPLGGCTCCIRCIMLVRRRGMDCRWLTDIRIVERGDWADWAAGGRPCGGQATLARSGELPRESAATDCSDLGQRCPLLLPTFPRSRSASHADASPRIPCATTSPRSHERSPVQVHLRRRRQRLR